MRTLSPSRPTERRTRPGRDAAGEAHGLRHAGVGHGGGVLDVGDRGAQADRQLHRRVAAPEVVEQRLRGRTAAAQLERDHGPAPPHLVPHQLVLREVREAGVVHAGELRLAVEEMSHVLRGRALRVHAHGQVLEAERVEPRFERRGAGPEVAVPGEHLGAHEAEGAEDGARDGRRVAVDVLRQGVHDEVRAQAQRLLEVGRAERVVHDERDARAPPSATRCAGCPRCAGWDSPATPAAPPPRRAARPAPSPPRPGRRCRRRRRRCRTCHRPRARLSVLPYTLPRSSASPWRSSARSRVLMAAMPDEKTRDPMVGSVSPAASAFSTTWCASSCSITRSRYAVVGLPRRV